MIFGSSDRGGGLGIPDFQSIVELAISKWE